jgi:transcriptional regulator with XRE-family HTH domain
VHVVSKRFRRTTSGGIAGRGDTVSDELPPIDDSSSDTGELDPEADKTAPSLAAQTTAEHAPDDPSHFELPPLDGEDPLGTLSRRLQARRTALGMSIADVARRSHVSAHTLEMLEKGPLEKIDAPFYIKNRLRVYAEALGVDSLRVAEFFEQAVRLHQTASGAAQRRRVSLTWVPWLVLGVVTAGIAALLLIKAW